jgi:hypothetical protein
MFRSTCTDDAAVIGNVLDDDVEATADVEVSTGALGEATADVEDSTCALVEAAANVGVRAGILVGAVIVVGTRASCETADSGVVPSSCNRVGTVIIPEQRIGLSCIPLQPNKAMINCR